MKSTVGGGGAEYKSRQSLCGEHLSRLQEHAGLGKKEQGNLEGVTTSSLGIERGRDQEPRHAQSWGGSSGNGTRNSRGGVPFRERRLGNEPGISVRRKGKSLKRALRRKAWLFRGTSKRRKESPKKATLTKEGPTPSRQKERILRRRGILGKGDRRSIAFQEKGSAVCPILGQGWYLSEGFNGEKEGAFDEKKKARRNKNFSRRRGKKRNG